MKEEYLQPTWIIDCDHPTIVEFAHKHISHAPGDPVAQAVRLYYAVRDGIWYDPYVPFFLPEHYRTSHVLQRGRGYCVNKAALLVSLGRAVGIPGRLGFADVRNHIAGQRFLDFLGTDLFVFHGYVEFYLENRWVKATPAFNRQLCDKHQVPPLDFNGREDSIFHAYNMKNEKFMEYVQDHGSFSDVPVDTIVRAWEQAYGKQRVQGWKELTVKADSERSMANSDQERLKDL